VNVSGLNVLVTGGARGMGNTFVNCLARDGANVAFCDLDGDAVAAAEAEARGLGGGKVHGFVANVADEAQVAGLFQQAVAAIGPLGALVNNAGILRDGLLVKVDRETGAVKKLGFKEWQSVIDVNLTGPFLCGREFAAHVIEAKTKSSVMVQISSIARHGNMGQTNYSAAKAGLVAMTKLWAGELARYGIRTGAIAPGFTGTPMVKQMRPEVLEAMLKPVPLKRIAEPEEMYQGVKFIIECDYFTGRTIDIDGGLVL
jgi:3-oxoacyl-[acyl-carrier protein] reductase